MRPYQGNQEDEDPDIKKIKKVNMSLLCLKGGGWDEGCASVFWSRFLFCFFFKVQLNSKFFFALPILKSLQLHVFLCHS